MPYTSVTLRPGVDVQKTFSLNEAGVSVAQLIRYKEGLIEAYGGWQSFVPFTTLSTARDSHVWQDAAGRKLLALGCTANLSIIVSCAGLDITPATVTTNPTPSFSVSSGSNVVTVADANAVPSSYNSVFFRTPVAISNLLLNGIYQIQSALSTGSYTILATADANTTVAASGVVPLFTTSSGNAAITVELSNNNFQQISGLFYPFYAATTIDSTIVIQGPYEVQSIVDTTSFIINAENLAETSSSKYMNNGNAQLEYFVSAGPQVAGSGYGAGGYGDGGYGYGVTISGAAGGTTIMADDWSLDNWGSQLLACQKDGPIYFWSENSGFQSARVLWQAPLFNGGIFVSMPQQILVAWKSTQPVSESQGNLQIRWSDAGDYTNWEIANDTSAGSFVISKGSVIRGGMQAATQGIIWTDIGVWVMRYIGGDAIFNITEVGTGCGLVAQHAAGRLAGVVYWMSDENFYIMAGEGVAVLPCSVWDFVFQNINRDYIDRVKCAPNSAFNEISWFFPSGTSTGENDSYVKYNVVEQEWDYGTLPRTTWVDVSVLGSPIGIHPNGAIYQHEVGEVTSGGSNPKFQSGWWSITDGNDLAFVDFVIPDFRFAKWTDPNAHDAAMQITFFAADYPQDTPRSYGPYAVDGSTQYLTPRIRGRLMSVLVEGDGLNWWRLGRIRYRFALSGRR